MAQKRSAKARQKKQQAARANGNEGKPQDRDAAWRLLSDCSGALVYFAELVTAYHGVGLKVGISGRLDNQQRKTLRKVADLLLKARREQLLDQAAAYCASKAKGLASIYDDYVNDHSKTPEDQRRAITALFGKDGIELEEADLNRLVIEKRNRISSKKQHRPTDSDGHVAVDGDVAIKEGPGALTVAHEAIADAAQLPRRQWRISYDVLRGTTMPGFTQPFGQVVTPRCRRSYVRWLFGPEDGGRWRIQGLRALGMSRWKVYGRSKPGPGVGESRRVVLEERTGPPDPSVGDMLARQAERRFRKQLVANGGPSLPETTPSDMDEFSSAYVDTLTEQIKGVVAFCDQVGIDVLEHQTSLEAELLTQIRRTTSFSIAPDIRNAILRHFRARCREGADEIASTANDLRSAVDANGRVMRALAALSGGLIPLLERDDHIFEMEPPSPTNALTTPSSQPANARSRGRAVGTKRRRRG